MTEPELGRILTCTECRRQVAVLEAAQGARTDDDHEWINPDVFVCGSCHTELEAAPDHASELRTIIDRARERQHAKKTGRGIPYRPEAH